MTDKPDDKRPDDAAVAAIVRAELAPLLSQVAHVMNMARDHGLTVNFNIGMDQWGRRVVGPVDVTRPL
jgi:hypothetical protein